jgi:hypothetical protein
VDLSGRVSRTLFTYRARTYSQAASRTDAVLSAQYYVKAPDIPRDTIDAVASSVYRLARVGGISRLSRDHRNTSYTCNWRTRRWDLGNHKSDFRRINAI